MIKLNDVTKKYYLHKSRIYALKNINLKINAGELVLISGPSGSGKSTFLNLIAGISRITEGKVRVNNKEISRLPEHFLTNFRRDKIGIIFQDFNLLKGYTVFENIELALVPAKVKFKIRKQKINTVLNRLNMLNKINVEVNRLSGGEQQRTAIARAIINDPDIILADEPTSNIDQKLSEALINVISELSQQGKTIIISSHDNDFIDSLDFSRKIFLEEGKITKII